MNLLTCLILVPTIFTSGQTCISVVPIRYQKDIFLHAVTNINVSIRTENKKIAVLYTVFIGWNVFIILVKKSLDSISGPGPSWVMEKEAMKYFMNARKETLNIRGVFSYKTKSVWKRFIKGLICMKITVSKIIFLKALNCLWS